MANRSDAILEVAQELIQTRGYAGFSYRDVASAVGIKSASIHYHFPTKADLVVAVAQSYRTAFAALLAGIDAEPNPRERLLAYADVFEATLSAGRLCLCGMLAAETDILPEEVRAEVVVFFEEQRAWLRSTLEAGIDDGSLPRLDAMLWASLLLSTLEGAMILARSRGDRSDLRGVVEALLPT